MKKAVKKAARSAAKAAKKIVRKATTAVKKATPIVHVTVTRKVLGKAPQNYTFHLHDGRSLDTVYQLVDELETMTEDAFRTYVNGAENHFANWIEHVFDDKALASDLRKVSNRVDTQVAILKHLVRELVNDRKKAK